MLGFKKSRTDKGSKKADTKRKKSDSKMSRFRKFRRKFGLDSRKEIERFGVVTLLLALSGAFIITGSGVNAYKAHQEYLVSNTIFTPTFTTSLSDVNGKATNVFLSQDKTRAMVLMSFGDAGSNLPLDANEYNVYLTSPNGSLKGQDIQGKYVVFGSGEYAGIILDKPDGFTPDIYKATIKSNRIITASGTLKAPSKDKAKDTVFDDYDLWSIEFNPAAKDAQTVNLGKLGKGFDPVDIYYEAVAKPKEEKLRKKMNSALVELQTDLNRIKDMEIAAKNVKVDDRGSDLYMKVPPTPSEIDGDEVLGKRSTDDNKSTLYLQSAKIIPGGYDFDWRAGNVKQGYLDAIVPKGQSYIDFVKTQHSLSNPGLDLNRLDFTLSNGKNIKDYASDDTFMKPMFKAQTDLLQAWSDYYKHKAKYQTEDYNELLEIEISLRSIKSNSSVNNTDAVLKLY